MAQVPINGNIEMFDGPNSIYEVIVSEFAGAPSAKTFDAILTYVKTFRTIADFHPSYRPASINDINETSHFRGFPHTLPTHGTWYVKTKGYILANIC